MLAVKGRVSVSQVAGIDGVRASRWQVFRATQVSLGHTYGVDRKARGRRGMSEVPRE